jgi:RNA polymerase sigma-70 factor, ECF subfamily
MLIAPAPPPASVDSDAGARPAFPMVPTGGATTDPGLDAESRAWIRALEAGGARTEEARGRLYELLLGGARTEINRRRGSLPHLRGDDFDDLAHQAANDAMLAILRKLSSFRGDSRFTTWAYKFVLLEAAVKLRRRAWQGREVPLEPEDWSAIAEGGESPAGEAESRELLDAIRSAIETELSPHQRQVLVAVALNGVPIDVLAERLDTTRGALYKTIHDARKKLRAHLADAGLSGPEQESEVRR